MLDARCSLQGKLVNSVLQLVAEAFDEVAAYEEASPAKC